jgi:hypothetical protein
MTPDPAGEASGDRVFLVAMAILGVGHTLALALVLRPGEAPREEPSDPPAADTVQIRGTPGDAPLLSK